MRKQILAGALALALPAAAQAADPLYSNNFEANRNGITGGTLLTAPNGSTSFIGNLTQGAAATLTLNTAGYSSLTLTFDLYAIYSLDGDQQAGGADADGDNFTLSVDGRIVPLSNFTYANFPNNTQNFPIAGSAPRTGATAAGTLGYSFSGIAPGGADATYAQSFTFAPTGDQTVIRFTGNSNQVVSDEFFGIDNVAVTGEPAVAPVPEPATWATMLLGFGAIGVAARRRRAAAAIA